jgi:hypothetical protein
LSFPSGIVLSIIGPSLRGEFIVFALLSFLGLVGFATAFRRSYPHIPLENYARWIFLFPSLWYWPASLGKEAIILLGVGLVVSGFFGQRGRKHWPTLFFGTFLVFAVRPQVCAVLLFSLVLAHWLSIGGRWTPRKVTQGVVILTLGSAGILQGMSLSGVESFDVEGIQDYMETDQARSTGGSSVGTVDIGLTGVPMAFLNIVARPFIWEAGNVMALVSALEVLLFWSIVWYRRRNLRRALHEWRLHPMLRLAVPFVLIYSVSLGLMVVNLGIIARQRIFLFPFLFLLLEAAPAAGQSIHRRGRRPPRPSAGRPSRLLIGTPHR